MTRSDKFSTPTTALFCKAIVKAYHTAGHEDISGPARLLAEPNLVVMTAALTFSNHGHPPPIVDRIGRIAPRRFS